MDFIFLGADINGLSMCQIEAEALQTSAKTIALTASKASASPDAEGDTTLAAAEVSVVAIRELLKVHTAYFHTKDMRLGGTPLHWATEKTTMEAFIGKGQLAVVFSSLIGILAGSLYAYKGLYFP